MSMENSPDLALLDVSPTVRRRANHHPDGGHLRGRLARIGSPGQWEEPLGIKSTTWAKCLRSLGGSIANGSTWRSSAGIAPQGVTARVTALNAHKTGVIGIPGIAYLATLKHNAVI